MLPYFDRKAWVKRQSIKHTYGDDDDDEVINLLSVNMKCRNPYALVQPELQLSLVNVDYPIMLMWKSVARDARSVGACLTNEAVTEIVLSTRDVYHSSCLVKNYFQSCCYVCTVLPHCYALLVVTPPPPPPYFRAKLLYRVI